MKLKKLSVLIRKCKSLSSQMKSGVSCYCSSSKEEEQRGETVYVGSSRRRYVIDTKYLRHPLINALIDKSRQGGDENERGVDGQERVSIKCEVVLFDHLLWMLENADPNSLGPDQSLEDLAELYML